MSPSFSFAASVLQGQLLHSEVRTGVCSGRELRKMEPIMVLPGPTQRHIRKDQEEARTSSAPVLQGPAVPTKVSIRKNFCSSC